MSIMKKRDATFNYGCLMAELKEKMVQFRSRMKQGDEEDQSKLVESKGDEEEEEEEFKVMGEKTLISKDELSFSLNDESDSNILVCPGRLGERNVVKMMSESEIELERVSMDTNESRLELAGDSRMFPYPICFVSRSLPTPPKDYNLRKTGIDLNGSNYLDEEEVGCSRVSRKLMFIGGKEKKEWSKFRNGSKKDYYCRHNLRESQEFQELMVIGKEESSSDRKGGNSRPIKLEDQAILDYSKEKNGGDLGVLRLPQVIGESQVALEIPGHKKEKTNTNVLLQSSQSLENIKSLQENIPSKCKNSQSPQFSASSRLVKDDFTSSKSNNSCNQYSKAIVMTITDDNTKGLGNTSERHPGGFPVVKKKSNIAFERGNIITTRYYKMASQLRVTY